MKRLRIATLCLSPVLVLFACEKPAPPQTPAPSPVSGSDSSAPAASLPKPPTTMAVDGVTFDVPGEWPIETPDNTMRAAQFRIPAPAGSGLADASSAVFRGIRGGSAFNLARWDAQFVGDDKQVEQSEREIAGAKLYHFVGMGTFDGGMAMGSPGPQPDMMVLGVLIELDPERSIYIKATGPRGTLEPARALWDAMVNSIAVASPTP